MNKNLLSNLRKKQRNLEIKFIQNKCFLYLLQYFVLKKGKSKLMEIIEVDPAYMSRMLAGKQAISKKIFLKL